MRDRRFRRKKSFNYKKLFVFLGVVVFIGIIYFLYSLKWGFSDDDDIYSYYPLPSKEYRELTYSPRASEFYIWAPEAEEVRLLLYKDGSKGHASKMIRMELDENTGVWSTQVAGDLEGTFFAYNAKYEGIWRGDAPGLLAEATGVNGKRAAVVDMSKTNPVGWGTKAKQAASPVLYTLHLQEFTNGLGVNQNSGNYLELVTDSLFSSGSTIGLAHLKELGVTHVRLKPIADFAELDEILDKDELSFSQGRSTINYMVPEGFYSKDPTDPTSRIKELKEMINELHRANISVVLDFSFANIYQALHSNFERIIPGYFFIAEGDKNYKSSSTGYYNTALHRPFVQQFINESLIHWVEEYKIDGINLLDVDQYPIEMLEQLEKQLKKRFTNLLVLGSPSSEATDKDDLKIQTETQFLYPSSYFSYSEKEAQNHINDYLDRDVESGDYIKLAVVGGVEHKQLQPDSLTIANVTYLESAKQVVNRIDLSALSQLNVPKQEFNRLAKLAYTLLFTSQGTPELKSGEEFLDVLPPSQKDSLLATSWSKKSINTDFYAYVSKLIQLRQKHPAFHLTSSSQMNRAIEFIPTASPLTIAYRIKDNANNDEWEDIIVAYNSSKTAQKVALPEGRYIAVCRDGIIHDAGLNYYYGQMLVAPQSATIIYRSDKDIIAPPIQEQVVKDSVPVLVPKKELILPPTLDLKIKPSIQEQPKKIGDLKL